MARRVLNQEPLSDVQQPLFNQGLATAICTPATTVDGADRAALERICHYLMRPAFGQDAVEALEDGRVPIHFKAATRRGARILASTEV